MFAVAWKCKSVCMELYQFARRHSQDANVVIRHYM